jgi:hypothetical protein
MNQTRGKIGEVSPEDSGLRAGYRKRYAVFITVIIDRLSHDIPFFYGGDNHMMNRKDRRRRVGYNSSHA